MSAQRLPLNTQVVRRGPVRPGMRGWVVGFDEDLQLPLMEWADECGPEAMHTDEYEVITCPRR